MSGVASVLSAAWRALTRPLIGPTVASPDPFGEAPSQATDPRRLSRLLGAVARRLLLAPVLLAGCMTMLVMGSTHHVPTLNPPRYPAINPTTISLFHRDVEIQTAEGVRLAGWHIPAWSARNVPVDDEQRLIERRPGLVLCHGAWSNRAQLLHLAPALHAAGYELLLIDLRGCGESQGDTTLGHEEWRDVRAAVRWMQGVGGVDPRRIGVIATDVNAAAALQAASVDPAIRVVVADRPSCTLGSFLARRFSAMGLPGGPMGRLYKWSFALAQRSDLGGASAQRWAEELGPTQALLVTARQVDPFVPPGEPLVVHWAARGPKELKMNPFPADVPGQPAVLPADLVRFLAEHMKPDPPAPPPPPADDGPDPD